MTAGELRPMRLAPSDRAFRWQRWILGDCTCVARKWLPHRLMGAASWTMSACLLRAEDHRLWAWPPRLIRLRQWTSFSPCRRTPPAGTSCWTGSTSWRRFRRTVTLYERLKPALTRRPDLVVMPVSGDIVLGPRSVVEPDLFVIPKPTSSGVHWRDVARLLLVVEVLSRSTAARDRGIKRHVCISAPACRSTGSWISTHGWWSAGGRRTSGRRSWAGGCDGSRPGRTSRSRSTWPRSLWRCWITNPVPPHTAPGDTAGSPPPSPPPSGTVSPAAPGTPPRLPAPVPSTPPR